MNKNLVCLLVVVALLPACGSKKKKAPKTSVNGTVVLEDDSVAHANKGKKPLFLDDSVDEYAFEEETGTFSGGTLKDAKTLNIVESTQAREWEERKAEQAKHGFKTIYFDFNQYTIRPDQKAVLQHDLEVVRKVTAQGKNVIIEGHACNFAGSEEYNLHLSEDRAKAVKDHFVAQGVAAQNLQTVGRGFEMCIVESGNQEQQAPNRRVELYISNEII